MRNFLTKQSGSEVILEEVNPYPGIIYEEDGCVDSVETAYSMNDRRKFTPLIITSIDPNIKVGQVIREDQLEPDQWQYLSNCTRIWTDCAPGFYPKNKTRQVAKLKQPVHETPKYGHDLETCTEKEEKVTGETVQQDREQAINKVEAIIVDWLKSGNENATYLAHMILQEVTGETPIQEEETEKPYVKTEMPKNVYTMYRHSPKHIKEILIGLYNLPLSVQEHKPESEENTYTFKEIIEFVKWYSGMSQEKIVNAYNRYLVENKDLK